MAASASLRVTVRGAGGHGSAPHNAKDPISVAAQIVGDLQTLVTRRFDVFDPIVITVGSFNAGTARTIIPDEATFDATVRAFSTSGQDRIEVEAVRLCRSVAAAYGMEADVSFEREYPATINAPDHAQFVESVVADTFGDERFQLMQSPQPGSEDFSRVIREVPGCYMMLGARIDDEVGGIADNHSPRVQFDESVLVDGTLLHARLALAALRREALPAEQRTGSGTAGLGAAVTVAANTNE